MQAISLALASGVERIAVYKLYDQALPAGGESFGLTVPSTGLPRPAYYSYQMVIKQFADVTNATLLSTDNVDLVLMNYADGHTISVMWTTSDSKATVEINATGEKAYLLDQYGNMSLIRPVEEMYRLDLEPARCTETDGCFIGGAVKLLLQTGGNLTIKQITPEEEILLDE